MALWVERTQGERGSDYIAEQVERLARSGDEAGVTMWRSVAERLARLGEPRAVN